MERRAAAIKPIRFYDENFPEDEQDKGNVTEVYKSVINCVVEGVSEMTSTEDCDNEAVLELLRQLWISKIKKLDLPHLNIEENVKQSTHREYCRLLNPSSFSNELISLIAEIENYQKSSHGTCCSSRLGAHLETSTLSISSKATKSKMISKKNSVKKCSKKSSLPIASRSSAVGLDMPDINDSESIEIKEENQPCECCYHPLPTTSRRNRRLLERSQKSNKTFDRNILTPENLSYRIIDGIPENNKYNVLVNLNIKNCVVQVHPLLLEDNKLELIIRPLINKIASFSINEATFILQDTVTRALKSLNVPQLDGPHDPKFRIVSLKNCFSNLKLEKLEQSELDSDDDVTDDDTKNDFENCNEVLCKYEKVKRSRNCFRLELKHGVVLLNGQDFYFFNTAKGTLKWA